MQKTKKLEVAPLEGKSAEKENPSSSESEEENIDKVNKGKYKKKNWDKQKEELLKKYKKELEQEKEKIKQEVLKELQKEKKHKKHKKKVREIGETLDNIEEVNDKYGKITSPNVEVKIQQIGLKAVIDSGADTNIISTNLVNKLGLEIKERSNVKLTGFNGAEEKSKGRVREEVNIGEATFPITLEVVDTGSREKLLFGINWLKTNNMNLNLGNNTMTLTGKNGKKCRIPITIYQDDSSEENSESEYESDDSLEGYGSDDSQFNDTD